MAALVAIQLWNVRTRTKEPFTAKGEVGMYVCGLTVYDHAHIGHARTYVSFDVLRRWLEKYHSVRHVQNVTDVDDKIISRAAELDVSPAEHAAKWDQIAHDALRRLGVRDPDEAPHVASSIPEILAYIQTVIERGFAYATPEGNVYFDVPTYDVAQRPDGAYGALSRRDYRELAAGTRKRVETDKKHPADFALWKAGEGPGSWDAPWGVGRPGWHIECSVMSTRALGPQIDIHGGGQDLIFPHHENEIAQAQAHSGTAPFARFWVHTGFLNVDGQKMSKSLGNFIVLDDLLDEMAAQGHGPEILRFYFIQTHYRSKIDFTRKGLDEAATAVERLNRLREALTERARQARIGCADVDPVLIAAAASLETDFSASMDDDLHTPGAIAALFAFARTANAALSGPPESPLGSLAAKVGLDALERCGTFLTLFQAPVETLDFQEILDRREAARAAKDWGAADAIRDELAAKGYAIEDTPSGPRIRKSPEPLMKKP